MTSYLSDFLNEINISINIMFGAQNARNDEWEFVISRLADMITTGRHAITSGRHDTETI